MRILCIDRDLPAPPVGGGQIRTHHLMSSLAERHDVTVIAFASEQELRSAVEASLPYEVLAIPWQEPPLWRAMHSESEAESSHAYAMLTHEDHEPWFASCWATEEMEDALRGLSHRPFDVVLMEHSGMARFLPIFRGPMPVVVDMHNLHSLIATRAAQIAERDSGRDLIREAERTVKYEKWVVDSADQCVVVSVAEAEAARQLLGLRDAEVVPNGVDTSHYRPAVTSTTSGFLLFTGLMSYEPNVDAVLFFQSEVMPLVNTRVPEATFHVVGANPHQSILQSAAPRVVVHGAVPDTLPFFREADVVVAPVRSGGGTRLKLLEAAACGKAIVSTSFCAEGLGFRDGRELVLRDTPAGFANAIVSLLEDSSRRQALGKRAREAALRYDWAAVGKRLAEVIDDTVAKKRRGLALGLRPPGQRTS